MTVIIGETATLWTNRALRNEFDSKSEIFTRMGGKRSIEPRGKSKSSTGADAPGGALGSDRDRRRRQLHQIVLTALDQVGGSVH